MTAALAQRTTLYGSPYMDSASLTWQVRLLRLFKFIRIRSFFQNWEHASGAFSHPLVLRLLRYFMYTCVVAHLMACIAFLIPQLEGVPDDSWVVLQGVEISPTRVPPT